MTRISVWRSSLPISLSTLSFSANTALTLASTQQQQTQTQQSQKKQGGQRVFTLLHVGFDRQKHRFMSKYRYMNVTFLEQENVPVVEVNGIRTVETALGKGICTLFHGSPAMFS